MATCQSCGAQMSGAYCNTCGARAPEERAKKPHKDSARPAARSAAGQGHGLAPRRVTRTTALGLIGIALFGAGMLTGFWMAGSRPGGGLISAAVDATSGTADAGELPAIAAAGKLMDEGVDLLDKGERTAAVDKFRKATAQYEQLLKSEPDNQYARTYMGLTYYYMGDSKKALENLRAVLDKDPNYLWAIFNLAWVYETGGKSVDAMATYQKYIDVAPAEKENTEKYAEQPELIDRQLEAAKAAVAKLKGGTGQ
jgi:hypothetical protein